MASVIGGPKSWGGRRDKEGHLWFNVSHQIQALVTEGPNAILFATGLPQAGSAWNFLSDSQPWAFCTPEIKVTPNPEYNSGSDLIEYWIATQHFTTKPPSNKDQCWTQNITNPLLEPPKYGGSFLTSSKVPDYDRNGDLLRTVSHERWQGLKLPVSHPTVWFSKNYASIDLAALETAVDNLNSTSMWGVSPRGVWLDRASWERRFYGTCTYYYNVRTEFKINLSVTGWDPNPIQFGKRVLNGRWKTNEDPGALPNWVLEKINGQTPDVDRPDHFIPYPDRNGNPLPEGGPLKLDGTPALTPNEIVNEHLEIQQETDFITLFGLPAVL